MAQIKLRGIVLKEFLSGESSKQIVVLTKEHGKMLLSANGARNSKSKLLAATQLFCYSDFMVEERKAFRSITQAELLESFYPMRQDIIKLSYGAYILELVDKTIMDNMECNELLELIIRTFQVLSKSEYSVKLAVRIFEIKFLQLTGFMPDISQCNQCAKSIAECKKVILLSEGIVCESCFFEESNSIVPSKGALKALTYITQSSLKQLFHFRVSDSVLEELKRITMLYFKVHIDIHLKSLEFAENL